MNIIHFLLFLFSVSSWWKVQTKHWWNVVGFLNFNLLSWVRVQISKNRLVKQNKKKNKNFSQVFMFHSYSMSSSNNYWNWLIEYKLNSICYASVRFKFTWVILFGHWGIIFCYHILKVMVKNGTNYKSFTKKASLFWWKFELLKIFFLLLDRSFFKKQKMNLTI